MKKVYLEVEERRKERLKRIEIWAKFVKTHKREEWKPQLKDLIDSQIIIANRFYKNLEKTPPGKEKIRKLMNLN
jgi:hypothetical protein